MRLGSTPTREEGTVGDSIRSLVAQLADVWLIVGLLAVANVALLLLPSPVRLLLAGVFLCLLPGYALTTLVFPARRGRQTANPFRQNLNDGVLGEGERAALSLGLSVALLPLFGIGMAFSALPLTVQNILLVVTAFVVVALAGGTVRRLRTSSDARYKAPFWYWLGEGYRGLQGNTVDVLLNVGLAVVVIAAMSTFAMALTTPQDGVTYTEASLLTESPDGKLVAGNYPTELGPDGRADLVLRVSNHEGEDKVYTVVVQLQRLEAGSEGARAVTERSELLREVQRVESGESWEYDHTVTPTLYGEDLRVAYLVYAGTPPANPTTDNAYRYLSLSVDVTEPA
ncbi:DUF1616 domain-containing protein [Halomicroarcula sp. GCM10025817]|uniref:DUF1616 domain-containing protein n=1 Tax=Haloarcula TaxID=2237 RepID=UPI0023E8DB68|nr:DUF1616 domain-containing protein [Halomicroarcula sp. SYNS111]